MQWFFRCFRSRMRIERLVERLRETYSIVTEDYHSRRRTNTTAASTQMLLKKQDRQDEMLTNERLGSDLFPLRGRSVASPVLVGSLLSAKHAGIGESCRSKLTTSVCEGRLQPIAQQLSPSLVESIEPSTGSRRCNGNYYGGMTTTGCISNRYQFRQASWSVGSMYSVAATEPINLEGGTEEEDIVAPTENASSTEGMGHVPAVYGDGSHQTATKSDAALMSDGLPTAYCNSVVKDLADSFAESNSIDSRLVENTEDDDGDMGDGGSSRRLEGNILKLKHRPKTLIN